MEGKLRGKLVNKNKEEESKLKGKLLNSLETEKTVEIYSEDWLKEQTILNRDDEKEYRVVDIYNSTMGSASRLLVKLQPVSGDPTPELKRFSDLIDKIKTPGSAWSIK